MQTDYILKTVRSAAILTDTYVAGTVIDDCAGYNQLTVLIDFTIGSLTSLQVKIELSPDGTTYYQETANAVSGGTSTGSLLEHSFTAAGKYRIVIPINDSKIKISAKGTGTMTNSSCAIKAVLGNV